MDGSWEHRGCIHKLYRHLQVAGTRIGRGESKKVSAFQKNEKVIWVFSNHQKCTHQFLQRIQHKLAWNQIFLSTQIKEATVHTTRVNAGKGSLPMSSRFYNFTLPNPKHQADKSTHFFPTSGWYHQCFINTLACEKEQTCISNSGFPLSNMMFRLNIFLFYPIQYHLQYSESFSGCLWIFQIMSVSAIAENNTAWSFIFRSFKLFLYRWHIFHSDTLVSTGWMFCQFSGNSYGLENKDLIQNSKYLQTLTCAQLVF